MIYKTSEHKFKKCTYIRKWVGLLSLQTKRLFLYFVANKYLVKFMWYKFRHLPGPGEPLELAVTIQRERGRDIPSAR